MLKVGNIDNYKEKREKQLTEGAVNGWVLLGYTDKNTIDVTQTGEGGFDKLADHLQEDQVQYGIVRVSNYDGKARDLFFTYFGPQVPNAGKENITFMGTKENDHYQDAQSIFRPYYEPIIIMTKNGLTDEKVVNILKTQIEAYKIIRR